MCLDVTFSVDSDSLYYRVLLQRRLRKGGLPTQAALLLHCISLRPLSYVNLFGERGNPFVLDSRRQPPAFPQLPEAFSACWSTPRRKSACRARDDK